MSILKHLDKKKLHHAYLVEGTRDEAVREIIEFFENINIKTSGSPDFVRIFIDNFKIEQAQELRTMSANKSFLTEKRVFVVCANSITIDAQNVLLKMFEEPVENTHFFLVVPDANALLKTVISRFYLIKYKNKSKDNHKTAENFLSMKSRDRIDFMKELLATTEEENGEDPSRDSARTRALEFLDDVEFVLSKSISRGSSNTDYLEHLFKIREYLRMPGSSVKSLMESLSLIVPQK